MKFISILLVLTIIYALPVIASLGRSSFSNIKDYDYICLHISNKEALIFKTSAPQKIWQTTLNADGQIKKGKAFEFSKVSINSDAINKEGHIASFQAELIKNYEIKGLFTKDIDDDLPLTVVTNYAPDGNFSRTTDHYNCALAKAEMPLRLGMIQ